MKNAFLVFGLVVALGFSSEAVRAGEAPTSEAQLRQQFESALSAKDKSALLSLFNWKEVSPGMKSLHEDMVDQLLRKEVKNVKASPFPTNFPVPFVDGGVRYSLNLKPVGLLEVEFAQKESAMPFPFGKIGNFFYIGGMTEELVPTPETGTNRAITIRLQNAAGNPLPMRDVVCAVPDKIPSFESGRLFGGIKRQRSDSQGRLVISLPDGTNLFLVTADAEGFGWMPSDDLTNNAVMLVQPWGRIEGTRMNRGHAVAHEHLMLGPDRDFYGGNPPGRAQLPVSHFSGHETTTDAQGHFAFDRVPPLKMFLDRQEKQRAYWGYFWSVELKPGETRKFEINTRGRTVLGRVETAPGLDSNIDLASCSGALMSTLKDREGSRCSVGFPISSNGTFRADHVEPGDYKITGDIWRDGKRIGLLDPILVHVPDDTSDAEDVPYNMGTVVLKPAVNFMQGDTAPDFSCETLEGKPLKLSSFRGKYVLLDFWATWCKPCVAEMPHLKAAYDAFGKDERLAMISLSLDSEPAAPRKFVRSHEIAWTQGFLGESSKDKVTQLYGAYGIPAIYLIGPDGKVLATDLRGVKIKEAVANAVAH